MKQTICFNEYPLPCDGNAVSFLTLFQTRRPTRPLKQHLIEVKFSSLQALCGWVKKMMMMMTLTTYDDDHNDYNSNWTNMTTAIKVIKWDICCFTVCMLHFLFILLLFACLLQVTYTELKVPKGIRVINIVKTSCLEWTAEIILKQLWRRWCRTLFPIRHGSP